MFDNLSDRLERSFKILKGEGKITDINISETLKDIRRALLDADVSYKVAKDFCDRVKQIGGEIWCDPTVSVGHIALVPVYPGDHLYGGEKQ